jgi:branched-subunit amino acid ABC-type transport system permease component
MSEQEQFNKIRYQRASLMAAVAGILSKGKDEMTFEQAQNVLVNTLATFIDGGFAVKDVIDVMTFDIARKFLIGRIQDDAVQAAQDIITQSSPSQN